VNKYQAKANKKPSMEFLHFLNKSTVLFILVRLAFLFPGQVCQQGNPVPAPPFYFSGPGVASAQTTCGFQVFERPTKVIN